MKKVCLVLTTLLLIGSMMAFAQGVEEQGLEKENKAVTITLATGDAIGSLRNLAGWHFKELIDAQPDLKITVNHVEGAVLGSAGQIMD